MGLRGQVVGVGSQLTVGAASCQFVQHGRLADRCLGVLVVVMIDFGFEVDAVA